MIVFILVIALIAVVGTLMGVFAWRNYDIGLQCQGAFGPLDHGDLYEGEWSNYNKNYVNCLRSNGIDVEEPREPEPYKPFWEANIPEDLKK